MRILCITYKQQVKINCERISSTGSLALGVNWPPSDSGAWERGVGGVDWPPNIWSWGKKLRVAIIFVSCLNKCIYHLHLGPFPLYCINNQHDFTGWDENHKMCFMIRPKTWFLTLTPMLKKWFPRAWSDFKKTPELALPVLISLIHLRFRYQLSQSKKKRRAGCDDIPASAAVANAPSDTGQNSSWLTNSSTDLPHSRSTHTAQWVVQHTTSLAGPAIISFHLLAIKTRVA